MIMKKIKIKICNYNTKDKFSYGHFIENTLKKYYDVELSENPDYLFYTDSDYNHLQYDCIKIYYTGENISPNFNLCDYAIGFDYINFEDRYYRLPLYLITVFYRDSELKLAGENYLNKTINFTKEDLLQKTDFCSFVYSNYRGKEERKEIFDKLNEYKKVNSGGAFLNNIGGRTDNKLSFETKHKFSIAFENSSRSGYTTEKIVSSLVAKTIPIYWGNPNIGKEFNTKRFINCHDYKSFDDVLEKVKELDNDDEAYLKIINEQISSENYNFEKVLDDFELFLKNIFDQPLEKAERKTINPVRALEFKKNEIIISKEIKKRNFILKIISILYKPFKKINFLENLKYKYFKS